MSTLKKLLAMSLALAMVLSFSAFAGNYTTNKYGDAASISKDCEGSVELMYALDIMKGDEKNNFNPNATITRAEMAKTIYVIMNYGKDDLAVNYKGSKMFKDVEVGSWYEGYVNYCAAMKLVQGRGDGTFGPNVALTAPEAAKMLLTAIGYSAADRGYTGKNWDKNVLSDASIIGLLKGYNYPTNTYAPRQWMAVMFENALLDAYTYTTMAPVPSNGLMTSIGAGNDYVRFGEKYYALAVSDAAYLYATNKAIIAGTQTKTSSGAVRFYGETTADKSGNDVEFLVKGTDLGIADLGQQFRVIYNKDNNKAYSVRNTGVSVVAQSAVKDASGKILYATSNNDAANKYEFTVDKFVGKLNGSSSVNVNVLSNIGNSRAVAGNGIYTVLASGDALYQQLGKKMNDTVKVIDKDGDGDIDYVVYTAVDYAYVTSTGTSSYYGAYITAKVATGNGASTDLTYNNNAKLYLNDVISTADTLTKGNYVKLCWNLETGKMDMSVLPVVAKVAYNSYTNTGVYTIGGVAYQLVDNGFQTAQAMAAFKIGNDLDVVADNGMIIFAQKTDGSYNTIDKVNEQLVLVTDLNNGEYSDGFWGHQNGVKYMTIDGKTHMAAYVADTSSVFDNGSSSYKANAVKFGTPSVTGGAAATGLNAMVEADARLFILHTNSDGSIYLENISTTPATMQAQLNIASSLLQGYFPAQAGKMDGTNDTFYFAPEMGWMKVNSTAKMFVYYDGKYQVLSMEQLGNGIDSVSKAQALVSMDSFNVYTMEAGYLNLDGFTGHLNSGYLYITSPVTYDGNYNCKAMFADGTEKDIKLANSSLTAQGILYAYSYNALEDEYTLVAMPTVATGNTVVENDFTYTAGQFNVVDNTAAGEIVALNKDAKQLFVTKNSSTAAVDVSNCVIAVRTVLIERDENQFSASFDTLLAPSSSKVEFVALKDLANTILNGQVNDQSFTYYSDFTYNVASDSVDNVLYITVYQVANAAQAH